MDTEIKIQLKTFQEMSDNNKKLLEKTYEESFPVNERRDFSLIKLLIKEENRFEISGIYQGQEYVGFISRWDFSSFLYIEHFAIDPLKRNHKIGYKVLTQMVNTSNKPIILEVEMPNNELSERRIGFYKRIGFTLDDHVYFQPPYHQTDSWFEMRLMSYGKIDLGDSFGDIRDCLYKNVYGVTVETK
jgi:ribosomal protein S18 acetylase RimI-like enzyme